MSRSPYNVHQTTSTITKEKCTSCELLNILRSGNKHGQKRCKECVEKENKRKMKLKHIPVHLRRRDLREQTEKAERVLTEQKAAEEKADADEVDGEEGRRSVGNSARRSRKGTPNVEPPKDQHEEQVKLSDILELALELLDLVESHVSRNGSREEIQRFEQQIRVLRRGRDSTRSSQAHLEDKRAIIIAFSIFTDYHTLLIQDYSKLKKKNEGLKQLAYDTAELVRRNEKQYEEYANELKTLQGTTLNVTESTRIELTRLRNEITNLKLELNLRTNELRELQLEYNAHDETLRKERERSDTMRREKDQRITSLLSQLQSFSLDYEHEKNERARLEKENERLWNDRMAYRAEQIQKNHLTPEERAALADREAYERMEHQTWKQKSKLRDAHSKERMRASVDEARRDIEIETRKELERTRKEIEKIDANAFSPNKTREQGSAAASPAAAERPFWMEEQKRYGWFEQLSANWPAPVLHPSTAIGPKPTFPSDSTTSPSAQEQESKVRLDRMNLDEDVNRQIAEMRKQVESGAPLQQPTNEPASTSVSESNLRAAQSSPSMPYFSSSSLTTGLATSNPTLQYPPPSAFATSSRPIHTLASSTSAGPLGMRQTFPASSSALPSDSSVIDREIAKELEQQAKRASTTTQPRAFTTSQHTFSSRTSTQSNTDYRSIEEGLRRSREIRNESARLSAVAGNRDAAAQHSQTDLPIDPVERKSTREWRHHRDPAATASDRTSRRRNDDRSESEVDELEEKYATRRSRSPEQQSSSSHYSTSSQSRSTGRSHSPSDSRPPASASTRGSTLVGDSEAIPIRNMTLYKLKPTSRR